MSLTREQVAAESRLAFDFLARFEVTYGGLPHKAFNLAMVGSAIYSDAPKDVDFAVLVEMPPTAFCEALIDHEGFAACSDEDYNGCDSRWFAVRKGNLNLMVTNDRLFFDGYLLAMKVCQGLRLAKREDRIIVCQVVRDGIDPDVARADAYKGTL